VRVRDLPAVIGGRFRARFCHLYQIVMTRIGTPTPDCRAS